MLAKHGGWGVVAAKAADHPHGRVKRGLKAVAIALILLGALVGVDAAGDSSPRRRDSSALPAFLLSPWMTTIDTAYNQALLTQKMTKHFLLLASNMEFEHNTKEMKTSIKKS